MLDPSLRMRKIRIPPPPPGGFTRNNNKQVNDVTHHKTVLKDVTYNVRKVGIRLFLLEGSPNDLKLYDELRNKRS